MNLGLRRILVAGGLAALVNLGSVGTAQATVSLTLQEAGFASVTVTGAGIAAFTGAYGDFLISSDSGSSLGSSPTDAQLMATTLDVRNASAGSKTLTVTVTDTFTSPTTPTLILKSGITGNPGGGSLTFVSSLNGISSNAVTISGTGFFAAPAPNVIVTGAGTPFTLRNVTTVVLGANGSSNSTGTTDAVATPEPATLVSAIVGLPLFGLMVLRRRQAKA